MGIVFVASAPAKLSWSLIENLPTIDRVQGGLDLQLSQQLLIHISFFCGDRGALIESDRKHIAIFKIHFIIARLHHCYQAGVRALHMTFRRLRGGGRLLFVQCL